MTCDRSSEWMMSERPEGQSDGVIWIQEKFWYCVS